MKKKRNILIYPFILIGALLMLTNSCKKDDNDPPVQIPVLTTSAVLNITQTTASCGGNITSDGGAAIIARGVCWSTSQTPTIADNKTIDSTGTGTFTSSITGITASTTYYARAYATNSAGTSYGNQISFTTSATIVAPTITTTAVSTIAQTTAASGGNVTSNGGATVTVRGVCWSTSQTPTIADSKTTDGTGTGTFTSSITGLTASTTYYARAYATNSAGTSYGNQISFTTSAVIPTVTTTAVSAIAQTTAASGGNVTSDGGATVTARGVCWSTSQTPTIADSKTTDGSGSGGFTSNITGLTANTTYYVRAYATNIQGTGYGSENSFVTLSGGSGATVTDIDGNVYHTVTIGTQVWMVENLKTTKYRDGTSIPNVTGNTAWDNLTTGAYSDYGNTPSNSDTYGRLYNWYAVTDVRNICPTGWHVPTDAEWTTLTTYLGGESVAGGKLKETGTTHWNSPNLATNQTGFTALPSGYRLNHGTFYDIGNQGYWWSSSAHSTPYAWYRNMHFNHIYVYRSHGNKPTGFPVRCLKD